MRPCLFCRAQDEPCYPKCQCAKCLDPVDYEEWRHENADEYEEWLEEQIEDYDN